MRRIGLVACLWIGVVGAGCKGEEHNFFQAPDLAGFTTGDGATTTTDLLPPSEDGPTLGLDLLGVVDPNGPTITIQSPASGAEVQYDTLEVTALIVAASGSSVDASSVTLSVPSQQKGQIDTATMSLTATPGVYRGQISISHIPSGASELSVSAKDILGRQSVATATYLHDGGPVLTFVQPTQKTAKGSINVELLVDDKLHPLTDASKVRVGVRSLGDVTMTVVPGAVPLRLTGVIDFSQFSPPLDGDQLIAAEATNDKGTIGRAQKGFIVDNVGPAIAIVTPTAGQFIGGIVEIKATISDISDVIDSSVLAIFGNDPTFSVNLTRQPNSTDYIGQFDVRQLGKQIVLPTLSVRAEDKLGNESEVAEVIVVDNEPPGISLDPPNVRIAKLVNFERICSIEFDPLGDGPFDPPNDGATVQQVFSVRARAEDRGNHAPGLAVERPSLIQVDSVDMFAIAGANGPLVVDTDGDGKCDSINPLLIPSTKATGPNEALSIRMAQITTPGVPDFLNAATDPLAAGCTKMGEAGAVLPGPLCDLANTYMTVSLYYTSLKIPSIWTIPPVGSGQEACVGYQLDTLNRLDEGPTCLAVRARDIAGNPGVSMPLRVCIDRGGGKCGSWTPPNCTGTFNPVTNVVTSTPCTDAQPFPSSGEVVVRQ